MWKGIGVLRTTSNMPKSAKMSHMVAQHHRQNATQTQTVFTISPASSLLRKGEELVAYGKRVRNEFPIRMKEKPACPIGPRGMKEDKACEPFGMP